MNHEDRQYITEAVREAARIDWPQLQHIVTISVKDGVTQALQSYYGEGFPQKVVDAVGKVMTPAEIKREQFT